MSQSRPWQTSTFVLCPGAGSGPEYWYRLTPLLEQAGHTVVPVALPNGPGATLADQADAIVAAAGASSQVVLVAQSMAGFSAPLACDRLPVAWLVLVNAMIPAPGETAGAWWDNTGQPAAARANDEREGRDPDAPFDLHTMFLHDLPPEVVERVLEADGSRTGGLAVRGPVRPARLAGRADDRAGRPGGPAVPVRVPGAGGPRTPRARGRAAARRSPGRPQPARRPGRAAAGRPRVPSQAPTRS